MTALWKLNCSQNRLTSLDIQGLTDLEGLFCFENQLTSLDAQDLTALRELWCSGNKLAALELPAVKVLQKLFCYGNSLDEKAFIRIFTALPDRKQNEAGKAFIYSEEKETQEKNITDFFSSAELKTAFEAAKAKNWEFYKRDTNGNDKKI